jgi:ribosomal protein S18 acetylase RimI-like enzyme
VDFGVLEKYRNNGIGNKLMDIAEQIAPDYSDTIFSPQGAGLQLYL